MGTSGHGVRKEKTKPTIKEKEERYKKTHGRIKGACKLYREHPLPLHPAQRLQVQARWRKTAAAMHVPPRTTRFIKKNRRSGSR
jgi:hypothetical protein